MLHQLQLLMGSPTVFSKLEVTSVVVVAIVSGMVLGGLVRTTGTRRAAGGPLGYPIASRGPGGSRTRRTMRSNADRPFNGVSAVAFAGWQGAGPQGPPHGSGQWVNLAATATYLAPTTMLPLAALPSAASPPQAPQLPGQGPLLGPVQGPQLPNQAPQLPWQGPQSPVSLLAPQSPAYLVAAPISPAIPLSPGTPLVAHPGMWPPGGSPLVELQPVAFLPGVYQAATYRLDVTGRADSDPAGSRIRPLWRLGNALFSTARSTTVRAITPPAGSPPDDATRPGRHRASNTKRMRRSSINSDTWMRK